MTEEQFNALVELIRTIADETFWRNEARGENTGFYGTDREREIIAWTKEKLVGDKNETER